MRGWVREEDAVQMPRQPYRRSEFLGGESHEGGNDKRYARNSEEGDWGTGGARSPAGGRGSLWWRQQPRTPWFRSGSSNALPRSLGEALSPLGLCLLW